MADPTHSAETLRAALLQVLKAHRGLPENDMYRAFGEAVRTLRDERDSPAVRPPPPASARQVHRDPVAVPVRAEAVTAAAPVAAPAASPVTPEFLERDGQRVAARKGADGTWRVGIEILTHGAFMSFGQQLHRSGVMLQFLSPLPLNAEVDVCVMLPVIEGEIWYTGRVVFVGPVGTALDLKPAQADHPQLWNRASKAFGSGATAANSAPRIMPDTEPPRLRDLATSSRGPSGSSHSRHPKPPSRPAVVARPSRPTRTQPSPSRSSLAGSNVGATRSSRGRAPSDAPATSSRSRQPSQPASASRGTRVSESVRPVRQLADSRATSPPVPSQGPSSRAAAPPSTRSRGPASRTAPVKAGVSRAAGSSRTTARSEALVPPPVDVPVPAYARLLISLRSNASKAGVVDHFAMLGVHWSAYQSLIDEAWARERFFASEEHYPATLSPADAKNREDVEEALDAAYRVLREPSSRRSYRDSVVDRMNLQSAVGLYWDKGDTGVMRSDLEAAVDFLQRVLELDPNHKGARAKLKQVESALK